MSARYAQSVSECLRYAHEPGRLETTPKLKGHENEPTTPNEDEPDPVAWIDNMARRFASSRTWRRFGWWVPPANICAPERYDETNCPAYDTYADTFERGWRAHLTFDPDRDDDEDAHDHVDARCFEDGVDARLFLGEALEGLERRVWWLDHYGIPQTEWADHVMSEYLVGITNLPSFFSRALKRARSMVQSRRYGS